MANPSVVVDFLADTSRLSRAIKDVNSQSSSLAGKFGRLAEAGAVGVGVGLGVATVAIMKTVDAASDLNESVNAVNVTFGKASKQVLNFSNKAARQAGLSMSEFNELVTPVGASLINVGYSADEAAKASINLAKRSADMASVFNTTVPEAMAAVQAGLRGEADPLERFGVGLSDAAVKAKAMALGLADSEKALTAQDKAQARVALLMEQTNRFAGDFVRTSGGYANAQRVFSAEWKNFQAVIGTAFLPIAAQLMSWLSDKLPGAFATLQAKVGPAIQGLRENWPQIQAAILQFWSAVQPTLVALGQLIVSIATLIRDNWGTIGPIVAAVANVIRAQLNIVANIIRLVAAIIRGDWSAAWDAAKAIVLGAVNLIRSILQAYATIWGTILRAAWAALQAGASAAWNAIKSLITSALQAIVAYVTAQGSALVRGFANAIRSGLGAVTAAIGGVKAGIVGAFAGAAGWLVSAGAAIVQGLASGIRGAIQGAVSAAQELASRVLGAAKGALHIGSPSTVMIQYGAEVSIGLADGIKKNISTAEQAAIQLAERTLTAARNRLVAGAGTLASSLQYAFGAAQSAVQTESEKILATMEATRAEQQRQRDLAAAQAAVTAATSAEELTRAQQQLADAQFAIDKAALETKAKAERAALDAAQTTQKTAFDTAITNLQKYLGSGEATAEGTRKRIRSIMDRFGIDMEEIGALLGTSFASGVQKQTDAVVAAAKELAGKAKKAVADVLGMASPSRVMVDAGQNFSLGFALGIRDATGAAVGQAATLGLRAANAAGGNTTLTGGHGGINVRVYIGDTELRGLVRAEVVDVNTGTARTLLAGAAG